MIMDKVKVKLVILFESCCSFSTESVVWFEVSGILEMQFHYYISSFLIGCFYRKIVDWSRGGRVFRNLLVIKQLLFTFH